MENNVLKTFQGGCHCGAIQFEVDAERQFIAHACNCSMCQRVGYLHLIVPKKQFRLTQGETNLACYQFNTKVAKHYFCQTCGVKSFYVPRSNPDGISVNVRCLNVDLANVVIEPFDGRNWEQNAETLRHLSK
ncbi:MAG: GFA family protein [Kangiellaceae bacterium]|nr:GFA family protein [Kangiellaceae bacterium]